MSNLFSDFDKITPQAWKQKIQVDLKGADYNETLLWQSEEGITVKPFYTEEDRRYFEIPRSNEGFAICQSVFVDDEKIANSIARNAVEKGATAIQFIAKEDFNYELLLDGLVSKELILYFKFNFLSHSFFSDLSNFIVESPYHFQFDLYGNFARTGNWFKNEKSDISELSKVLEYQKNSISVDASLFQNAGANKTQELAYALAVTNEYIETFGKAVIPKINFQFSVGGNYFFEIAKLRAFRVLLNELYSQHDYQNLTAHIFCTPSKRNKTIYDYNVNMLRTTSECMSAILGGADTVGNLPYDAVYHKSNNFGERISRNQLLILQQESYLSHAHSISEGSYYIEDLTYQLASKALEIFKQIEKGGGYVSQLKKGNIQKKIQDSAAKEQKRYNNGELVLLGSNKLANPSDRMKDNLELYPFVKTNKSKTLIPPIIEKRLAEEEEQNRLTSEQ